ncbi:unnamed protein product [Clonostachys solani]|uniref:Uncharacterized protein n=1 Tax=Clonostachys solani TaxID=160281 RepID=A0A9P0EL71_9HYPO|nr:unnamed protein product [Clonostachys solani]
MSGLGVALLCLETIQGCKWLLSKVRTYRRFSREFGKLRTRLEVQMELFRDESEFVLAGTSTEPTITALLDGGDTEGANMDELEDRLQDRLSGKYTSYRALFEEIYNTTTALKGEFQKLDASYSEMVTSVKSKIQVAIASLFKFSQFQEDMTALTDLVSQLRHLRKSMEKRKTVTTRRKVLSKEFRDVRRCTASLHTVLSQHWSCKNSLHIQHAFSLLITPTIGKEIELRAIIWKEVVPEKKSHVDKDATPLRITCEDIAWSIPVDQTQTSTGPNKTSEQDQRSPKRLKTNSLALGDRVRVYRPTRTRNPAAARKKPKQEKQQKHNKEFLISDDLALSTNFCSKICGRTPVQESNVAVGYLESPHEYRYAFSHLDDQFILGMAKNNPHPNTLPLSQVLSRPLDEKITIVDQLNLALALAKATLHFWSTPWWSDYWRLDDLRFDCSATSISECVKTIHLRTELAPRSQITAVAASATFQPSMAVTPDPELEKATLVHGIRNINLHCLGVALLQIGRWTGIQADDIQQVRRLSSLPSQLGSRYRSMTEKCLECDFGVGKDLGDPRLQGAMYDTVIRELEKMISALELEDEESL